MAWVVTYQEESKDQEITDHEVKKGYMYASEILTLNGFVANQFDGKTQEAVVKGLLQDCYQSFGIDPKAPAFDLEQPHSKLPHLNKFWYMKKLLSSTDRTISETKMGLQMDMQSQGLGKALGASSAESSVVKVENQPYLDLKQPLGFWVDGVPVKWNRSESIILFTLNFPSQLHADFKTIRIPLTMINKQFFVEETMKDLLGIISWSFTSTCSFFPSKSNAWTTAIRFLETEASW